MRISELILWFFHNYKPLYDKMHDTQHGTTSLSPYHIENSVLTHTMMVLKQAELFNAPKEVVIAALLHDIGKIYANEIIELEEPIYVNSYPCLYKKAFKGHEGYSFFLSIDIIKHMIRDNMIDVLEAKAILKLISVHGLLYNYMKNGSPIHESDYVKKFGNYVEYMNAVELTKCDSTGRFTIGDDKDSAYKLGKEIYNADTYVNNYKVRKNKENLPILEILIGLPGCGKSTYTKKYPEAVVISRDNVLMSYKKPDETYSDVWKRMTTEDNINIDSMVEKQFKDSVKNLSSHIIVDMTNMSNKSRRRWVANASKYYHKATLFAVSIDECEERNKSREGKTIPTEVLNDMATKFSFPCYDIFDEVKIVLG